METYQELLKRQQKEFNDFPMIFAFNNKQLESGMKQLGLTISDLNKVYQGYGGIFYRKTDAPKLKEMNARHKSEFLKEINEDMTGEGFIFQMFDYMLSNHEYCITNDLTDTLDTLGILLETVREHKALNHGLQLAINNQQRRKDETDS